MLKYCMKNQDIARIRTCKPGVEDMLATWMVKIKSTDWTVKSTQTHWLPILEYIAPTNLIIQVLIYFFLFRLKTNPYLSDHVDIFNHPAKRLKSRRFQHFLLLNLTWRISVKAVDRSDSQQLNTHQRSY
jgi:hypothetical protein